jgi:hypothetical protein
MAKRIDLRKHKVQIADRYRIQSKVMVRHGPTTGGWVKTVDLSGKIVTVLRVNDKSIAVALRSGKEVSVFTMVTKGSFKVLPIMADELGI